MNTAALVTKTATTIYYVVVREDLHDNTKTVVTNGMPYDAAVTTCGRYSEAAERECRPFVYSVHAKTRTELAV